MQNNDYAGLSRKFDLLFPQVKELVEQTEQFYEKQYFTQEANPNNKLTNVRRLGIIVPNKADDGLTLPRLYFKKETDKTNPLFYVISTPNDEVVVYVGSNLDTFDDKEVYSVSAFTGGVVPPTESRRAYEIYLSILAAVRHYRYCVVYEIQTGYENIEIHTHRGITLCNNVFGDTVKHFLKSVDPESNTMAKSDVPHPYTDKIWKYVSAFKTMVENGITKESEPESTKKQEITIEYYGDDITFRFKNRVYLMTDEEMEMKEANKFEKLIPTSAKILCQTGDTVYDKYTSYISHKIKNDGKVDEKTARRLIKLQNEFTSFERSIIDIDGGDKHIEYGNIYLGDLEHTVTSYRLFNDGSGSRITVNLGKSPTLSDISLIACGIIDLFDLDTKTKVILDI